VHLFTGLATRILIDCKSFIHIVRESILAWLIHFRPSQGRVR